MVSGVAASPKGVPAGAAIRRILVAAGVSRVYSVPGESFLELLDEAGHHGDLSLISTRHESGAAFMAEAEAKLTGIPGVAAGTRGVGAANLAIGVHTAFQDSTPLVVLVGQVATTDLEREAFQEVDLAAFFAPITKWSCTVTKASRLPGLLAMGIVKATTGRPGPVMLALPADVLREPVPEDEVAHAIRLVTADKATSVPSERDLDRLVTGIVSAQRPVMIVGAGVQEARAELIQFAERLGIGVYTAFRRQDAFPNEHPNYLGHLSLGTPDPLLRALADADLVVVLGTRLDEITTQSYRLPSRSTRLIHIDVDPAVAADGVHAGWSMTADARTLLARALQRIDSDRARSWDQGHGTYLELSTPVLREVREGVDPAAVVAAMNRVLPADAIITNDAGNFSAFLHLYRRFTEPRTQLAPTSGAMGYGVPSAVAAALAVKDRLVVGVCGDGGFLMTGPELETAVRYGADLMIIVMRNGLYGTIAMHQAKEFGRVSGVAIGTVDLAGFARSLGAHGFTVDLAADLDGALKEAVGLTGVRVIDISTDADLISPAGRLSTTIELNQLAGGGVLSGPADRAAGAS